MSAAHTFISNAAHRRHKPGTMLRRLRVKMVMLTMGVALAIMSLCAALILGMTWTSNYQDIHSALSRATEEGPSAAASFSIGKPSSAGILPGEEGVDDESGGFFPVAIYLVSDEGSIKASNDNFVTMAAEVRDLAIDEALDAPEDEGALRSLGVFYQRRALKDGYIVAFADAASFYATVTRVGLQLSAVFGGTLLALLALSMLVSHLMTRPVERAWAQQREFIANASHELKTPLTVILANNDILAGHPELTVGEQMRWIEGTKSEATRMRGLIEDMLTLARSDEVEDEERLAMSEVDLSQLVFEAVLTFDAIAFEGGVTMTDAIDQNVHVRANAASMERLVKILIDNAVKYAGLGGTVHVRLDGSHKGHPQLSVNNTGPVIPREELPHVFDRFWRSDAARTSQEHGGYGLGLSIAQNIAQTHGARISVTSTAEAGTTFTVAF